jgi:hypothetical protein
LSWTGADELVERARPKLTVPAAGELEWFVTSLADYLRPRRCDFQAITQTIEAADKGDPAAHGALDSVFHEMLDAGEMRAAAGLSAPPQPGAPARPVRIRSLSAQRRLLGARPAGLPSLHAPADTQS